MIHTHSNSFFCYYRMVVH